MAFSRLFSVIAAYWYFPWFSPAARITCQGIVRDLMFSFGGLDFAKGLDDACTYPLQEIIDYLCHNIPMCTVYTVSLLNNDLEYGVFSSGSDRCMIL